MVSPTSPKSTSSPPFSAGVCSSIDTTPSISVGPEVLARMIQIAAEQMTLQASERRADGSASIPSSGRSAVPSSLADRAVIRVLVLPELADCPKGQYTGDIQDGKPHGRGVAVYQLHPDKRKWKRYEGEWQNGEFHGAGTLLFRNGSRYEGEWQHGKLHGRGTMIEADEIQTRYEGEFAAGQKHGRGTLTNVPGERYEGEWRNDQRNGRGIMIYASEQIYEGEFVNDYPEGRGVLRWPNGDKHEGEWIRGVSHGEGTAMKAGTLIKGIWKDGFLWSGTRGEYRVVEGVFWLGSKKIEKEDVDSCHL